MVNCADGRNVDQRQLVGVSLALADAAGGAARRRVDGLLSADLAAPDARILAGVFSESAIAPSR